MHILRWLFASLAGWTRQSVRRHIRWPTYGRRWNRHRPRRIDRYKRRRNRRRSNPWSPAA